MIVKCTNCRNHIYLTWMEVDEHSIARQMVNEVSEPNNNKGFWRNIKKWVSKKKDFQTTFYDGKTKLICTNCKKETRININNIISYQTGDFEKLGIFWTCYCQKCKHLVEPIPSKIDHTKQYKLKACPKCKNNNLFLEHIPNYLGGRDNFGLNNAEITAKRFFYFVMTLPNFCCAMIKHFPDKDFLLLDDLINVIIKKALSSDGELDLEKVNQNWKDIAVSFEKLENRIPRLNIISEKQVIENRKIWADFKEKMSGLKTTE